MKAYSLDFREKIVSAYKAGNTSIRKVAERFMVTKRTVHRLIKQKKERVDYWQEVKDKYPESLIFIDESAIWEGMERAVARSPKGSRAFCLRETYKGQKHTLIGAVSIKGLVAVQ